MMKRDYKVHFEIIVPPQRPEFTKYLVMVEDANRQFPVMKALTDKQEAYKLYDELKLKYEKR